jgi:zinc transport system substrate-binding protein
MLNLQQTIKIRMIRSLVILLVLCISCGEQPENNQKIITVSIAPFRYFVKEIAGDDFVVNVMVPPGADPHIYEPYPDQLSKLRQSVGYISNGYLGFEMIWLDKFYDVNKTMKRLSLSERIKPLVSEHHHEGSHVEGADPHYWVSPECALIMASSVRDFVIELNPSGKQEYEENFNSLVSRISELDKRTRELFSDFPGKPFMIFHPNLGYFARDYGLEEISVEYEGKEPSPSRVRDLIDRARTDSIKTIFVQREYDTKHAKAIAREIGAKVEIIDPLSEDWMKSTTGIIYAVYNSLEESTK